MCTNSGPKACVCGTTVTYITYSTYYVGLLLTQNRYRNATNVCAGYRRSGPIRLNTAHIEMVLEEWQALIGAAVHGGVGKDYYACIILVDILIRYSANPAVPSPYS